MSDLAAFDFGSDAQGNVYVIIRVHSHSRCSDVSRLATCGVYLGLEGASRVVKQLRCLHRDLRMLPVRIRRARGSNDVAQQTALADAGLSTSSECRRPLAIDEGARERGPCGCCPQFYPAARSAKGGPDGIGGEGTASLFGWPVEHGGYCRTFWDGADVARHRCGVI
jgi:hypothetical protein